MSEIKLPDNTQLVLQSHSREYIEKCKEIAHRRGFSMHLFGTGEAAQPWALIASMDVDVKTLKAMLFPWVK